MGTSPDWSNRSSMSVEVRPERSRSLTALLVVAYLAAALALLELPVPLYLRVATWAMLGLSLFRTLARPQPARVWRRGDGSWGLRMGRRDLDCRLLRWFCHPWLCVLHFKDEFGRRHAVVLPADAADADEHRRLRVVLNLSRPD